MSPFVFPVEPDPIPWLTERFAQAGCFERHDGDGPTVRALASTLRITSSVVTALSSSSHRFAVRFAPSEASASTSGKTREVIIGLRPMLEAGLTDGQRASLMVALAYHEVGHVIHTLGIETAVRKALGDPASPGIDGLRARYGALVFNLVHDLYLEAQQAVNFPGFAPTLRVKESFFGSVWEPVLDTRGHRWDALVSATLYPKGSDWTKDADVSAFFDWATRWAEECRGTKPRTAKGTLALVNEALDILRLEAEPEDEGDDPGKGEEDGRKEQESEPPSEDDGSSAPDPDAEPEEGEDEDDDGSGDGSDEGEEAPVGTEGTGDESGEGDVSDSDEEADDTREEEAPPSTARPQVHPYWEPKDIDLSKVQADIDRLEKVSVSGRDRVAVPNGAHKREVRIVRASRR